MIAVGDGRERFGHCITADSGNSVGEISGHSSQINSISIRQQRPIRAASGSDDTSLVFYNGVPFKYNTTLRGQHNRFVYGVAFSPDGSTLVSVGADSKIWLYDGKTGEVKGQVGAGEHKGSIFGVSWSKDSRRFATSSADQTVRIWDAEAGKTIQSWRMGEEGSVSIPDHQVGVVWPPGRSDGLVISLSLSGDLNYLIEGTQRPGKVVQGHQKNITALASDRRSNILWSGSSDGRVCCWDTATSVGEKVDGKTHTNYVSGISVSLESRTYSVGWDDTLRSMDTSAKTFTGSAVKVDGQPKGVAAVGKRAIVATHKGLEIISESQRSGDLKTKYTPSAVAATDNIVAVSGDDNMLHIYTLSTNGLALQKEISESSSLITTLAFSPDSTKLAAGFSNGKINVYSCDDWSVAISRWSSHTARVTAIAWSPSGAFALSGGLDSNIYVWSVANPGMRVNMPNAHKEGVNGVAWLDAERIASAGGDSAIKIWKVSGLS